jgi:small subunit ribosomal protein S6
MSDDEKGLIIMPQYEMMYIVASTISDDQIPSVTDGILKLVTDLGGNVHNEEKMGKKKLAYPIKKTRNGFYDCLTFEIEPGKISELNTKVLTTEGVIRHIIVNIDDRLARMQKDIAAQEKMNKNRAANTKDVPPVVATAEGAPAEEVPLSEEALDEKIEKALSEDLTNV